MNRCEISVGHWLHHKGKFSRFQALVKNEYYYVLIRCSEPTRSLLRYHAIIKIMLYGLIASNVIMFGMLLLNLSHLPPQIPLFFSRPWGEDQLADTWLILVFPLLLNVLYFVNISLYKRFFSGNDFVKKIIDYLNIFLMVAFTFIFVKIITLIT